jgi:hypothetical protein
MQRHDEGPGLASVVALRHVEVEAAARFDFARAKEADALFRFGPRLERIEIIATKGLGKKRRDRSQDVTQWIDLRLCARVIVHRPQRPRGTLRGWPRIDEPGKCIRCEARRADQTCAELLERGRRLDFGKFHERLIEHTANRRQTSPKIRKIRRMEASKGLFQPIEPAQQNRTQPSQCLHEYALAVWIQRVFRITIGFAHHATVCSRRL